MEQYESERLIAARFLEWRPTKWRHHFTPPNCLAKDVRNTFTQGKDILLLIDKMKTKFPVFSMSVQEEEGDKGWLITWGGHQRPSHMFHEKLEMALCLAILESLGHWDEEIIPSTD